MKFCINKGGGDYENIINEIVRVLAREGVYFTTGADFFWSDTFKTKILELEKQGKIRIKKDEDGGIRNIVKL